MQSGNNILFLADTIIDTDIGIFNLLKTKYTDSTWVNKWFLENASEESIKSILIDSCEANLVRYILNADISYKADELYSDIMTNHYDEVIANSVIMPDMLKLVKTYRESELSSNIKPMVLCRCQAESDFIHRYDEFIETTVIEDFGLFMTKPYCRMIVRHIEDLDKFDLLTIEGKSIIVLGYRYNFELNDDTKLLEKYTMISDINVFEIIVPYTDYIPPEG